MKYFLYARKSSESEDRQVQSIDDQKNRLIELAKSLNLNVVKVYEESKSAKKPDNRPEFQKMTIALQEGKAEGILCWQINRLSRNPVDSGTIQWLLQRNLVKSIRTMDKEYRPEDSALLFSIESGMANQFILDLSKNVKRGMRSKAEKGWRPGVVPNGYLNDKAEHTIIKDNDNFILLRQAWELMLTGAYTVPKVWEKLNSWGFKTTRKKRIGGMPLALSGMYTIFCNKFYAGYYDYDAKVYKGNHEPMITLDEFERVQIILGKKGKPRPKTHSFPLTGMISCGECGGMITAETKKKLNKESNSLKYYTYYHCTKRKTDTKCKQGSVSDFELESQISESLNQISIIPEFRDWALDVLRSQNDQELTDRNAIYQSQQKSLNQAQTKLDNLLDMKLSGLIGDDEYLAKKEALLSDKQRLGAELAQQSHRADNWMDTAEKVFNFAVNAKNNFENGTIETKKAMFATLGSNFQLKDRNLSISWHPWFIPIRDGYMSLEKEYNRLEPTNLPENKRAEALSSSVLPRWQAR